MTVPEELGDWTLATGADGPRTVYGQLQYVERGVVADRERDVTLKDRRPTSVDFDI